MKTTRNFLSAFLAFGILAQSASAALTLTWPTCVEMAEKGNADLGSALLTLEAYEKRQAAARSPFMPSVSGKLGYAHSNGSSSTVNTDAHSYSATLTGSQNLFNGLQDYGRAQASAADTEERRATLRQARARVSYELKSAFEGLRFSKEYQKLTREIIRRREENFRLVELRYESGRENKGSVLLSKAYLEQSKLDDLQALNSEHVARANLAQALGLDNAVEIEVAGEIPTQEPSVVPDFKTLAVATPEYQAARAREEAAGAGITVARSGFFPTLDVTGNLNRQAESFFPGEPNKWSLSVNLTLPLFNGGRDFYGTKAAIATWQSSENTRMEAGREARSTLEKYFAGFQEAALKLKVDESFRLAALSRAEIARKKYNNGLLSFEDWDVIENDLINRQKSFLQSKRDRVIAEAAWEQAQGKGVFRE